MEMLKHKGATELVNIFPAANKQIQDLILGSQAPEPQIQICVSSNLWFDNYPMNIQVILLFLLLYNNHLFGLRP